MKGSRVQISVSAPGGVREKERITSSTAKKSYVSTTCKTFSFSGVRREQLRAGVRLPAGAAVPSPETTGNEPRAAGPSAGRRHKIRPARLLFHLFSIPLLRNGSPNEAPGPGRLKGNAVKIGNSSLCCKFLPPKRHIRPRQSLATGFHATGKASGPERVKKTCRCNGFTIQGEMDRDRQEKRFPAYPRM